MVAEAGVADRFTFTGYRTDVPEQLATMDVLAVTSVKEGFGRTITEAMSTGIPVIAYDSGAPAEIIIDKQTGFLIPDLDVEELTIKMKLLAEYAGLRAKMGQAGLRRAQSDFDIPVFVERTEKILLEAAGQNNHVRC
jgi:glycosyltransferase involved in cell wall biosynthesis